MIGYRNMYSNGAKSMLHNVTETDFRNELCHYVYGNYAFNLVYAKMTLQIVIAM